MLFWFAACVATLLAAAVQSQTTCTANDVAMREPTCTLSGVCVIRGTHLVGDRCVLDFGSRPVVLEGTARLVVGWRSAQVIAGSLVLRSGTMIDARGQGSEPPTNRGGAIRLQIGGPVVVEGGSPRARIDASGNLSGGTVEIVSRGSVEVQGRVLAGHLTSSGGGGFIRIESRGSIRFSSSAELSATGGAQSASGGGTIVLDASEDVSVEGQILVNGSDGGRIILDAGGWLAAAWLRANGTGAAGGGGSIVLKGYRGVYISGGIRAQGSSLAYAEGGDGGEVEIDVAYGGLVIDGSILAEGAEPDGVGGDVTADVAGSVRVSRVVSARAQGAYGNGGSIGIFAGGELVSDALIDASGGSNGGDVELTGSKGIVINGGIDSRGRSAGGSGGEVKLTVGEETDGRVATANLTVTGTVDASGGGCEAGECGVGGEVKFGACAVHIGSVGRVFARGGGGGGVVNIVGHETVRIDGTVNCQRSTAAGVDGSVTVTHLNGVPPRIRVGGVLPLPILRALPACEDVDSVECLAPCTQCGDAQLRYPEECDDGNQLGCDGCSPRCRIESCNPAAHCVPCVPDLGCPPEPKDSCSPLSSPTATMSPTPEVSPTPTLTPVGTAWLPSPTPTRTPSTTPTATFTATRTFTPTPTRSRTPTWTPSPTATPTVTPTPRTRVDIILDPIRPVNIRLEDQTPATVRASTRVRQVKTADEDAVPVELAILASDCLQGSVAVAVDLDPSQPGNQAGTSVSIGKALHATVEVVVDPLPLANTATGLSPYRCRVLLAATAQTTGNQDPTPWNNSTVMEVNVTNAAEPWVEQSHQSVALSVPPRRLRLRGGQDIITRHVRVGVANADRLDVAGHAITLVVADGDCPTGTAGLPWFHRPGVLPVNKVIVPNRRRRFAKLPIVIRRQDIGAASSRSPFRCTLVLEALGPSGDRNPTDNIASLTLDIYAD